MGVLSALPLVNGLNACCCLWVVAGGVVAAYLLQQNQTSPVSAGDGAIVGFLTGLVGTLVWFVISIPIEILIAPFQRQFIARFLEMSPNLPPELRRVFESYVEPRTDIGFVGLVFIRVVTAFIFMVVSSIFSTIGGLLGAAIFRKSVTAPPPAPSQGPAELPSTLD